MLSLDRAVGKLFHQILEIPDGAQLFTSRADMIPNLLEGWLRAGVRIAGVSCTEELSEEIRDLEESYNGTLRIMPYPHLEFFRPLDKYHVAFSFYPFLIQPEAEIKEQVRHETIQDHCLFFRASEGKENRITSYHILGLEQMLKAVHIGGFFGAVLPERWIGRETKYLRWWNDNAALVARIKLPAEAVKYRVHAEAEEINAPGQWELCIWQRALTGTDEQQAQAATSIAKTRKLKFAEVRYNPFIFPLESLDRASITECQTTFNFHEWYVGNLRHWLDFLQEHHADSNVGTWKPQANELDDPREMYFFNPKPEFATAIKVCPDKKAIERTRHAVHLKANRSIRLSAYREGAKAALLDLRASQGFMTLRNGDLEFKFDQELKVRPFADIRDELLSKLESQGLVPCMTESEFYNLQRKERWLSIQLTPNERWIPVVHESKSLDQQSGREEHWEKAYADIGMHALFPEIIQMWRVRAEQMNLHLPHNLFNFQFEDLLIHVSKSSLHNGSVMGLGKTRLSLFAEILRGSQHVLIVCPAKLVGVWQDEIDNTIAPYVLENPRDWQGRIIDCSYQEIKWARDLEPANLRRFNIISYDTLKSTPKDGKFFKCPRCGTIVYSAKDKEQRCPGDPALPQDAPGRCNLLIQEWKAKNAANQDAGTRGRRKIKIALDELGEPMRINGELVRLDWKTHKYRKDHPDCQEFPLERVLIVDQRVGKPEIPVMELQENMYKKVVRRLVAWEEDTRTGEKKPIYKPIERSPHVKWTFAELVRHRFNHIIADEATYFMNQDAQQTQSMYHLCAQHRLALTGTPIKNKPQDVLGVYNWTFPKIVFPSYRFYDEQGMSRFLRKYESVVYIGGVEMPDGTIQGGTPKPIPKVNNPELFQSEIAPLMLRHTRNEPVVLRDIPRKEYEENYIEVPMDEEHKAYYRLWLKEFAEWWAEMKAEKENRKVPPGELLVKISYLKNCSDIPHNMLDNVLEGKTVDEDVQRWAKKIGTYGDFQKKNGVKPRYTSKMRKVWEMIRENVKVGDKTIVFSERHAALNIGQSWAEKVKLASMVVHGGIPLSVPKGATRSKRHQMIEQFRYHEYNVMWAGLGALAEGFNIPEANRGILHDCGWKPSFPRQGLGRMLRPGQKKKVYATYMAHIGAIDEYQYLYCYLKGRSADEAIDYMEFDDFSTDTIPDIQQYADCIVDGTEEKEKRKMWLAVEHLKKQTQEEGEE